MPSVIEAQASASQLAAALAAGVRQISENQQISFQPYVRQIMPLDGYVFWANANLLSARALAAAGLASAAPILVSGAVHFVTSGEMRPDENISVHKVVFTAMERIAALATSAPNVLYIGTWEYPAGYQWKFSFSGRNAFFEQSGLSHYYGDAVYPALQIQLIDTVDGFQQRQVVSNSLPAWLALGNAQALPLPILPVNISLPLYPSYLVPDNLPAPYGVVHIEPEGTRALQPVPYRDANNSHWQLAADRVDVILYGLRNDQALDWLDMVLDYSLVSGAFGLMNDPVIKDGKRTQQEIAAIAMQKKVEFEISYYQQTMRQIAQQVIRSAISNYTISSAAVEPSIVNWYSAEPVS